MANEVKILTTTYQKISTIKTTYGEIRTYAKYVSQDKTKAKTNGMLKMTYYLSQWIETSSATAKLNGKSKSYGYTRFNAGETTILKDISFTITHSEDGTSPIKSISTSWTASFGGSGSTKADIQAPKIARIPTITKVNNFTDEDDPTIEFTNPANFIIKPSLNFYYTSDTTNVLHSITRTTGITSPYTFTLSDAERTSLRNALKDKKEYTVRYTLKTYNSSGTYIGEVSTDKKFTIVNAAPTFTAAFTETNSKVSNLLGTGVSKIVKNASNIKVTITPSAKKGATIKSVEFIHGTSDITKTASPYETTLTAISNTYKVVVTDSRGFSTPQTITKTLIDYLPIEISQYSFKRVVPTSSDIKLNATIVYKQQTFNSTANAPTLKWKKGESGTWNTISSSSYSVDTTNNEITISDLLLSGVLPYTQSAKFYLSVSDKLTSDDENATVTVGIPVYDYGENDFQVNGDLFLADRSRQNKAPLNVSGNVSKNLFNGTMESGKYNTSGAKATDSASMRNTAPVKVEPNTIYIFSNNGAGVGMSVFEYDENYTFIKTATISGGASFTTSSTTRYINFFRGTSNVDAIQLEKGSTITSYEEYFEPTISIRNSNGVFQEINIIDDTGWIDVTLQSGFAPYTDTYENVYRRKNGIVELQGAITPSEAIPNGGDEKGMFYLPEGFRPWQIRRFICQGSGSNRWLLTVHTDGKVSVARYGTTSFVQIPAGAWLPFSVSFMVD